MENMDIDRLENVVEGIIEEWILTGAFEDGGEFLESESSDEDEPEREPGVCIRNYIENTVHMYSDKAFQRHFRLKRPTVYYLIERFQQTNFHTNAEPSEDAITHEQAFLMALWYLANTETFRQVADRFGLSRASAHRVLLSTLDFLNSLTEEFIRWPSTEAEKRIISDGFAGARNIHGIIGAIDGCHVPIRKPMLHQEDFYNRKKFHSVIIQAVCTHEKVFTDVYVGEPGSMHDARVLRRSPLYEKALEEPQLFGEYFLLGDSAYPSLQWLVPPFRDNGNLTRRQRTFNFRHSSTRVKIEHSFGLLRAKFRRLIRLDNLRLDIIVRCVMSACILHNISLLRDAAPVRNDDNEDEDNDSDDDDTDSDENENDDNDVDNDGDNDEHNDGDKDEANGDNADAAEGHGNNNCENDAEEGNDEGVDNRDSNEDESSEDENLQQAADRRQQIFTQMFRRNNAQ